MNELSPLPRELEANGILVMNFSMVSTNTGAPWPKGTVQSATELEVYMHVCMCVYIHKHLEG